jgi:hypothetical protein
MTFTAARKVLLFPALIAIFAGCQKETGDIISNLANPPTVNAGISQVIQLPATTLTLSGSATTEAGTTITAYLWSLVSGPNVPVITSPGSATTTITGFTPGSYIFQLMATNSDGLTGVDTTKILVNPSPVQTLTAQPNNNTNEVLLGLRGSTDVSDHAPPEICAASWTWGGIPLTLRSPFRFDLSTIPATATILSARLTLYTNPTPLNGDLINANSGPNNSMYIQRNTNSWTGPTITWFTQPGVSTADQVSIPHTSQSFLDLVDVDVKDLVTAMVSSGNYGFIIRLQNEAIYNIRNFCSSRYTNVSKHPKLVITYQ